MRLENREGASLLLGATCVGIAILSYVQGMGKTARLKGRLSVLTMWTCGVMAWPLIWKCVIQNEEDVMSLLWPILILGIDMVGIKRNAFRDTASKRSLISMDANAICSITFAMSGLMGGGGGRRKNDLFLYAMAGCAAFVLPSPFHATDVPENILMEAIQKTILAYSVGFLLGGVIKNKKAVDEGYQVWKPEEGGLAPKLVQ
jgi:hypothetical protein